MKSILNADMYLDLRGDLAKQPTNNDGNKIEYTPEATESHDAKFIKQLLLRVAQKRKSKLTVGKSRGLHSSAVVDLDGGEDAWSNKSTLFKDVAWYSMEDMLSCDADTKFLLCLHKGMDGSNEYNNLISDSAMEQDLAGIGGERRRIVWKVYYCLKVTMSEATVHHDLISGMMGNKELFYHYGKSAGFTVAVDGTTGTTGDWILPLSRNKLVSRPTDIMFFAPPRDCLRPFGKLFANQKTLSSCHAIFQQFALECVGDVTQSSLLLPAYN
jgi:hypothetical protein